jgi:CheY-like chemotaxis protein
MHDQQRLEAISRLAGGIGHDFNNLLGVILNFTGFVDAELTARPDLQADLGHIRAAAERAAELTRQLLTYARQEVAAPAVFDLRELLDDAEALLRPALSSGVRLSVTLPDTPCTVLADRHQLEQVLLNLAINAREAMPTGGDLSLVLSTAAGTVDLRVRDTGTGMAEDVIAHAFDPFFTTRETPGGGLGLASVYGIIAESHGEVELVSGEGEGTTVGIRLPAVARQDGAEGSLTAISASELVLLVEDEPLVRRMAVRLLENAGFAVIACDDPAEALDQAELLDGTVRVLVTDLSLPGMTGEQLAREIRTRLPAVAVVFMSGYTGDELARNAVRSATSVFLGKPFSGKELVDAVQRSLAVAPGPAPFAAGS